MQERCHLIVSGHVQGVCYRTYTQSEAQRLAITGWVRNTSNGNVEIIAEGKTAALCELRTWCLTGPPMAKVTSVKDNFSTATGNFKNFRIKY